MSTEEYVIEFQKKLLSDFPSGFQSWWPNFIFHYSDVNNIASVLNTGFLYSREQAIARGLMSNDNANDAVISGTDSELKKYVRFYFGAKTPTQYRNEGIKSIASISNNAHCPVPIFLLFDFVKLLSLPEVRFSNGNIAATNPEIYDDITDLEKLEFNYIYNRESLPSNPYSRHIIYCRHAEVLVRDELKIDEFLKYICVRSEAERETLLTLLDENAQQLYREKIKVFTKDGIFYKDRLHINKVSLNGQILTFEFSNAKNNQFNLEAIYTIIDSGESRLITHPKMDIPSKLIANIPEQIGQQGITFVLKLDGNLVYQNTLIPDTDIPF